MRYLLLIYQDEAAHAQWSQEALAAEYEDYNAFGAEAQKRGVFVGGRSAHAYQHRNDRTRAGW